MLPLQDSVVVDHTGMMARRRVDGMTWNVTEEGVRTRVAVLNSQPYPPPSVAARQQEAPGGEKWVPRSECCIGSSEMGTSFTVMIR